MKGRSNCHQADVSVNDVNFLILYFQDLVCVSIHNMYRVAKKCAPSVYLRSGTTLVTRISWNPLVGFASSVPDESSSSKSGRAMNLLFFLSREQISNVLSHFRSRSDALKARAMYHNKPKRIWWCVWMDSAFGRCSEVMEWNYLDDDDQKKKEEQESCLWACISLKTPKLKISFSVHVDKKKERKKKKNSCPEYCAKMIKFTILI